MIGLAEALNRAAEEMARAITEGFRPFEEGIRKMDEMLREEKKENPEIISRILAERRKNGRRKRIVISKRKI